MARRSLRGVYFRNGLRCALLALRWHPPIAEPAPESKPEIEPQRVMFDMNAPWEFGIDDLRFLGWRSLDGTAILPLESVMGTS